MKVLSTAALTLVLSSMATGELLRGPPANRDLTGGGGGCGGGGCGGGGKWGHLSQGGKCLDKEYINVPFDRLVFKKCNNKSESQMWKFDKLQPNENWDYGGILYNEEWGCLAVRGALQAHASLRVMKCDKNNNKQHWFSDGDSLHPRDKKNLCVAKKGDRVTIINCNDADSLDF